MELTPLVDGSVEVFITLQKLHNGSSRQGCLLSVLLLILCGFGPRPFTPWTVLTAKVTVPGFGLE